MWYIGGKHRQGKVIAKFVSALIEPDMMYIEPFCGSLSSVVHVLKVCKPQEIILSDIDLALITFWDALIFGDKTPPAILTDAIYQKYLHNQDPNDWLTAWYGYGCSFGGAWYRGLARHERGEVASYDFTPQVRSTMKKVAILREANVSIYCNGYLEYKDIEGCCFYLDPPYTGADKFHHFSFSEEDTQEFWNFARELSKHNMVIITAFKHPSDFTILHEWGDTVATHHYGKNRERNAKPNEVLVTLIDGWVGRLING